jgi:hypothetical protein
MGVIIDCCPLLLLLLLPWAASRLISHMPDSRAKAAAFEGIGCPREAAEVAAKLRDGALFARIQDAINPSTPAGIAIAQIKERVQSSFR